MSDSAGEKTEQPTQKKLDDGRKTGQVAQSQDVNKLFVTLIGIELVISLHSGLIADIRRLFDISFELQTKKEFSDSARLLLEESFSVWIGFIAILLLAVVVARLFAGFTQFGFLMAPEALKIDMNKLSPVKNAKNLFSKKKLVEFFGNVLKAIVLAFIFFNVIRIALPYIILLPHTGLESSIQYGIGLFAQASRYSLVFFLIISLIDFKLQKAIFIKSMMMTKDQVFREYKQSEGDPQLKSQRKAIGRELAESGGGTIKKEVESSDAVVVNPTHFAIAIEYKPGATPLPIIRTKGVDDRAKQIIEYAKEAGVPVVRHVTLARYLFRVGHEGKYIPRPSLQAMAIVFKTIFQAREEGEKLEDFHDLTES